MSDVVLVIVRHFDELALAGRLVTALADSELLLLFRNEELRTHFGPTRHATNTDFTECLLDPPRYRLSICFSRPHKPSSSGDYLLLRFLDEIGVPCLQIQGDLLTDLDACAQLAQPARFVAWQGPSGVGCPGLPAEPVPPEFVREDVVLICSALHHDGYDDEERYRFAFSLLSLAKQLPELTFIWRESPQERQHGDAAPLLSMLRAFGPDNLFVEEHEPFEELASRCHAAIAMASTSLLELAARAKPALVFAGALEPRLTSRVRARLFHGPNDLWEAFSELLRAPSAFRIEHTFRPLDPQRLREVVEDTARKDAIASGWKATATSYLSLFQEARRQNELSRLQSGLSALDRRFSTLEQGLIDADKGRSESERSLSRIEARSAGLEEQLQKLDKRLDKLLERVGTLQRSTLAYKTRKLFTRGPKGASES